MIKRILQLFTRRYALKYFNTYQSINGIVYIAYTQGDSFVTFAYDANNNIIDVIRGDILFKTTESGLFIRVQ